MGTQNVYSLKLILSIGTMLSMVSRVHALKEAFCGDFSPSVMSLESTETWLPFFGTQLNTLEQTTNILHSSAASELTSHWCLTSCRATEQCRQDLRRLWLDLLVANARESKENSDHLKDLRTEFVYYQSRKNTQPTAKIIEMFRTSCIAGCYLLLKIVKDISLFRCTCTDPCSVQRSCSVTNCTTLGIFEHQYRCTCSDKTVWDEEVYSCISKELYALRTSSTEISSDNDPQSCQHAEKCNPKGTMYCNSDPERTVTNCICKPQYTGDTCSKKADACEQRIQHPYLPNGGLLIAGNTACNVNKKGNSCQSFITAEGDLYYRCRCNGHTWIPNPELRYDNCLKRRTMCDSVICVFGKCVTTTSGTKPVCICVPGYSGKACTEWVGEWTEWSPWDLCRPACGDVRMTVRSRDCLSMMKGVPIKRECRGPAIEYAQCAEHLCARSEGTYIASYFAIRQNAIAASVSTAAIACATISTIWLIFCWSNLSGLVRLFFTAWRLYYRR